MAQGVSQWSSWSTGVDLIKLVSSLWWLPVNVESIWKLALEMDLSVQMGLLDLT